jgi:DNA-directed RNA polymerase subunit RPC12/RpoP
MAKCSQCGKKILVSKDSYIYNEQGKWCNTKCMFKWLDKKAIKKLKGGE